MKKIVLLLVLGALLGGCAKTEYVNVGPNWSQFYNLPDGKDIQVRIETVKENYLLDDPMSFAVTATADGKLWLISVGPDDSVSLLYPNEVVTDNNISANVPLLLPGENAEYALKASEPIGKNVILAMVTTGDMTRAQIVEILEGKPVAGATKAISIERRSPQWGSAKTVIGVVAGGK